MCANPTGKGDYFTARSDSTIAETVQILLDAKCDPNRHDASYLKTKKLQGFKMQKKSPLQNAATCLLPNTCNVLIEAKANVLQVDENGNNLLHQVVKAILEANKCTSKYLKREIDPLHSEVLISLRK